MMDEKTLHRFVLIVMALALLWGVGRQWWSERQKPEKAAKITSRTPVASAHSSVLKASIPKNESERIYRYILHVINHGSHRFHFPGGVMEGGYIPEENAPAVACYVMELGGHRCPHPYPKEAALFFSSSCAGCHGSDGKGIHGTYPDLTRPVLLGIEKME